MKSLRILFLIASLWAWSLAGVAQTKPRALQYWGDKAKYVDTQASVFLDHVCEVLDANPPATKPSLVRQQALMLLDAIHHDTRLDSSVVVKEYMTDRLHRIITLLRQPVKKKVEVYKVYNDGFIVRTRSTVVAIDVSAKVGRVPLFADDDLQELVSECDALFITHRHGDHADPRVARMFTAQGKPVLCPSDFMKNDTLVTHITPDVFIDRRLKLRHSEIALRILPGHQDHLQCNHFVLTFPEKCTVAHIGDQWLKEDMAWIPQAYTKVPPVDILIVDCWAQPLQEVIDGYRPRVVVTGHENELSHTIDHREAYWLTYYKTQNLRQPYVIMSPGERFEYK